MRMIVVHKTPQQMMHWERSEMSVDETTTSQQLGESLEAALKELFETVDDKSLEPTYKVFDHVVVAAIEGDLPDFRDLAQYVIDEFFGIASVSLDGEFLSAQTRA